MEKECQAFKAIPNIVQHIREGTFNLWDSLDIHRIRTRDDRWSLSLSGVYTWKNPSIPHAVFPIDYGEDLLAISQILPTGWRQKITKHPGPKGLWEVEVSHERYEDAAIAMHEAETKARLIAYLFAAEAEHGAAREKQKAKTSAEHNVTSRLNLSGRGSVLRDWVHQLPLMQQSVLLSAIRGPDGFEKEHDAKHIVRWFRRCVLRSAFDARELLTPTEPGGGSFTGPTPAEFLERHKTGIDAMQYCFLNARDVLPLHFFSHFIHAAEILGYKYPDVHVRLWWHALYAQACTALHVGKETEEQMDYRLGDDETQWRNAENGRV